MPRHSVLTVASASSQAEAERLVLDANGKQGLKTCSLRLAGIIG